jgi:hypothetical protein
LYAVEARFGVDLLLPAELKLLSELLSSRLPTTVNLTKEARNELEFVVGPVGIEPTTSRL